MSCEQAQGGLLMADSIKFIHSSDFHLDQPIKGLTELIVLNLRRTAVSDAALEMLKDMKKLKDLDLRFNDYITDDGMKSLQNLPSLRYLKLEKTKVGDAGMQEIGKLLQALGGGRTVLDIIKVE
jgi:hypothetical protein